MDPQDNQAGQLGAPAEAALPTTGPTGPEPPPDDADFIVTKEHRRFAEFATAVRRDRYIGLCYGPPGVGKTLSARRYACWHELEPLLLAPSHHFTEGRDRTEWHTLLYTPTVTATPRMIDKELTQLASAFVIIRTPDQCDSRTRASTHAPPPFVELLIIDETDRLKTTALEQLRDHYDRSRLGMILIGMPGIEKRLARYPQLYGVKGAGDQVEALQRGLPCRSMIVLNDQVSNNVWCMSSLVPCLPASRNLMPSAPGPGTCGDR